MPIRCTFSVTMDQEEGSGDAGQLIFLIYFIRKIRPPPLVSRLFKFISSSAVLLNQLYSGLNYTDYSILMQVQLLNIIL